MSFSGQGSSGDSNVRKLSFLGFSTKKSSGNEDPNEVHLDSEMEKVFAGPSALKEKFDVTTFQDSVHPIPGSFKNINSANRKNLPGELNIEEQNEYEQGNEATNAQNYDDIPEDYPLVSERAGHGDHSDNSTDEKRVQFGKKKASVVTPPSLSYDEQPNDNIHERKRRKSRIQYYRQRKFSHQDSVEAKKVTEENGDAGNHKISAPEDASLEEADLNELRSHRSDDPRALRRHKIHHSSIKLRELPQISVAGLQQQAKKEFDHSPHEIFVQLDELMGSGEDREWKETARWIKYEEDVQEGSDRWGKAHVSSLSFHSLLNLRRCLETGVVLLDLNEKDLPAVAYRVVEQMVVDDLIHTDDKPAVLRSLLLRHRHVNEHQSGFPFTKRKYNSYTSLQLLLLGSENNNQQQLQLQQRIRINASNAPARRSICETLSAPPATAVTIEASCRRHSTLSYMGNLSGDDKKIKIMPALEIGGSKKSNDLKIDMKDDMYSSSQEDLKKLQNDTILKRIPQGAEATTVLVGAVDFLEQPTIAFLRLAEGVPMPSLTEVPIPVRFMFILLGPPNYDLDYHEVGRAIATLMANESFHGIAYTADDRKDLLSAINEFLDDSIVLPPGNWDRHDLLPFEELKAKKDWIRSRKTKALQNKKEQKEKQINNIGTDLISALVEKKPDDDDDDEKKKPSPLEKTHRLWGGLRNDLKRRLPMYRSDILDGLNTETLAATIFMYFACLSTAITFGGLASDKTHNLIGISETLLSASVVGVIFHSLAGQPLVIIGTTGPLLLFDEALNNFCKENGISFLTIRAYIGIWLAVISILVSAFEGSVYVRLLTRFTQEIFSALITLIYIVETIMKLVSVYKKHPLLADYNLPPPTMVGSSALDRGNETVLGLEDSSSLEGANLTTNANTTVDYGSLSPLNMPNTALFCTILTLGTFTVAYYLKLFRNSHFLGRNARRALGDFGVPISITIFVMVDYFIPQVYTEKLSVPEGISPSDPVNRGWLVSLGPVETWLPFMAGIPALLVYILIFMESHISELIVDKPERGLKKGSGLHFDIVLLCCLNMLCGFFGMPWHCAATVRSVAHVSALTIMSRTHAPGESPRIIDVKEQRLSGFFVSLMIGLSVTMAPLLRLIPMAVLFGVFLYMGVASMSGVQFFDRVRLFFMPVKHYPPTPYVKKVPTWKMHLFTTIQVLCLVVLWAVKSSKISLAFPFFLVMMVPIRMKLAAMYKPHEIAALDGSEAQADEDEPDFYEEATIPA
ncbi:anion exchange protein 3-like isoform X1 [Musca domestica]|uniref:Anion exchange protein n=2 Tax=Musca domestica TaxID=7370 RepID=A0A1I8MF73_MUSDO|nr:anion exchange protein 3-like isoform X1 [Musca domestica]XP_058985724.1 anion exchange protein 3-like isoform X1 [Musca domestica]XP_058985725.1 anion exchange protein 3-like isoform X1 [Musca domestica]XP_058985726.1 anion exchange protein 3-like isoform X1 [Musca domestica]